MTMPSYFTRKKKQSLPFVTTDPHSKNELSNTSNTYHPEPTTSIIHQTSTLSPPPSYQNMPVSYQAFREITNFIRNNGDDWEEFRTKTAHTTSKAKRTSDPSTKPSTHANTIQTNMSTQPLDSLQKKQQIFLNYSTMRTTT